MNDVPLLMALATSATAFVFPQAAVAYPDPLYPMEVLTSDPFLSNFATPAPWDVRISCSSGDGFRMDPFFTYRNGLVRILAA